MQLDAVTSLFDLEQKAKNNAYYRQLAAIGLLYHYGGLDAIYTEIGKLITDEYFSHILINLHATCKYSKSCTQIVERINRCISYVSENDILNKAKNRAVDRAVEYEYNVVDFI